MTHLRAGFKRELPKEAEFTVEGDGVRVLAAVTGPDGRLTELRSDARAAEGERVVLAVFSENGPLHAVDGLSVGVRGPSGLLFELRGVPAGGACEHPVFLVGECLPRADGWWFVELGYGVPDGGVLANILRAGGADRAVLTALRTLPPARERPAARMLPGARLSGARLVGERRAGAVRLDVAVDLSGSMTRYSAVRTEAFTELIAFARAQLDADDVVCVIAFAGDAAPIVEPTRIRELREVTDRPIRPIRGGTELVPVLDLLSRYPAPRGTPRSLVVVTDAYVFDDRRELARKIKAAAYDHVSFVIPQPDARRIPIARERWFADIALRHLSDAPRLAVTYGEVFAALTGQRLTPAP
ncbi:vWA domain-containing protein [Actinocorallia longicatena]|uniref:VWFA domain-containing protein n=1 Tax=Actinocorallia longicatena TaxID=111803 RepID=A0ABP6QP86_9ACTN